MKKKLVEKSQDSKGKILIMEDMQLVRECTSRMLERIGYTVDCAEDGDKTIKLYKRTKEAGESYDAVILDLSIPNGMGGKETIKKLIKIDPTVKAIVSSSDSEDPVMADFKRYGFSGVLPKPYTMAQLNNLLNKVIIGVNTMEKFSVLLATRDDYLKEKVLEILNKYKYPTIVVNSCKNAIKYLLDFEFDLVIFDPDLKEMDGLDTIQLIKKFRPQIPIIVTSDDNTFETGIRIAKVGVYFTMTKPIDEKITKELIQSVEKKMRNFRNSS